MASDGCILASTACISPLCPACRGNERRPRRIASLKGTCVIQAAIGGWHCLAVTDNYQAYAWGGNEYGQCGVDQHKRDLQRPTPCLQGKRVLQVAAGGMHSVAITEDGQVGASSSLAGHRLC